jgi:hypothetical protein
VLVLKFGQWDYSSQPVLQLQEYRLEIKKADSRFRYSRNRQGQVIETVFTTPREPLLGLYPTKPLGLLETVNCILLRLREEVLIPPDGGFELELTCPFDLAVIITEGEHHWVVDRFPVTPVKYSLYGPPERGVVGRYHVSTRWETVDEETRRELALTTIYASNRYQSWVRLRQIAIPTEQIDFFYDENQAYTEVVKVEIKSRMLASVLATNQPPRSNLRRSPVLSPAQNKIAFDMEWGY